MSVAIPSISPAIQSMDLTSINTIRTLSMNAVQAANSRQPGTPMALAPAADCWTDSPEGTPPGPSSLASCRRLSVHSLDWSQD